MTSYAQDSINIDIQFGHSKLICKTLNNEK